MKVVVCSIVGILGIIASFGLGIFLLVSGIYDIGQMIATNSLSFGCLFWAIIKIGCRELATAAGIIVSCFILYIGTN